MGFQAQMRYEVQKKASLNMNDTLYRSVLYVPAHKQKAMDKIGSLDTDAVIIDLEDAVPGDQKDDARQNVIEVVKGLNRSAHVLVRINAGDEGDADLMALSDVKADGIVVPKVKTKADLDHVADQTNLPLWAMVETPQAVMNIKRICRQSAVKGIVLGLNDLGLEAGIKGRDGFAYTLGHVFMIARAHGCVALDGVFNTIDDLDGLRAECAQARMLGYDGKTIIHPSHIDVTNQAFSPTDDEVSHAKSLLEKTDESGAQNHDGMMVEALHHEVARRTLSRHKKISDKTKIIPVS